MPRINHLKIRKFGNVVPGTELRFDHRGVVLLGRNGTGKTTLLDLLAGIGRSDPGWATVDEYDIEFSMSCSGNVELNVTARCERAHASPSPVLASEAAADAVFSSLRQRARYKTLRIEALHVESGKRTIIESNDSETRCTYPDGHVLVEALSIDEGWWLLGLGILRDNLHLLFGNAFYELVSQSNNLCRFDEGLDYFRGLTERNLSSACIEANQRDGSYDISPTRTKLVSTFCAHLLLEDFKRNPERASSAFSDSSQIAYLELFCRLAGFARARIEAELDQKQQMKGHAVIRFSPLRFSLERDGSVLHHHHLSFGQRRLLAFLHYHDSTPSLVIADELVNGMHHEWISECLRLMQSSQAFISSQNPLLFDFLTFESPEEVANRFVICDLDDQHRFVWRNMSESDAAEFYEIYKTELQHVSAILRTRGYW